MVCGHRRDYRAGHDLLLLAGVALYGVGTQLHGIAAGVPVMTLSGWENRCQFRGVAADHGPRDQRPQEGEPIFTTAYHAHTAATPTPMSILLVGVRRLVMHGFETTLPVPLELMIMHGRAVMRGSKRALVSSTCRSAPMRRARRRPSTMPPR
jgi:hypothetical protein